jgi:hypothetical protein
LEDFFKNLFVIDSRKRMTFSSLVAHPLLNKYHKEFDDNRKFYQVAEKKDNLVYPDSPKLECHDQHYEIYQAYEDETRADLITQHIPLNNNNKLFAK